MSHLLPLLAALERAGCEVQLACLGEGGLARAAEEKGLSVFVLPMRGARDPRVLPPLRRLLGRKPGWEVVHTHGMRANVPTRLAAASLWGPRFRGRGPRPGRPCFFTTVHSDLRLDYASAALARSYEVLDRATVGWVDGVICVSEALRELLARRGYPSHRLFVVHSGLDTAHFARLAAAGEAARTREPRPARLGTVARLAPVKDIDLLLEVAAKLRRTHPQAEFVVVGDGPERPRLEAAAAQRGLAEVVRFSGAVPDVLPVLVELSVYLVTSRFEGGVSMAVLEAMAAGLPVVATAAGGVTEAVVDGETGYIVPRCEDREALAAALAERVATLLDHPDLRARLGAAGAERVRREFTVEETATRTLRLYERCLAGLAGFRAET